LLNTTVIEDKRLSLSQCYRIVTVRQHFDFITGVIPLPLLGNRVSFEASRRKCVSSWMNLLFLVAGKFSDSASCVPFIFEPIPFLITGAS